MKAMMIPEEVDESNSTSNGDSPGGTGALLGLTRKLRATLLENKQSYERDLKALKQQLEQQSEALASSAKEAFEVEKVELRLAGVNKLVAATKAKCERLEAQLTESQAKYSALETRIASATEQLLDKDREIAVLREQILENTKTGSEAEASLQQSLSNLAVLQISLSQTQEALTTARAEIAANLLEKAGLERALGELQRQIEQVEQNNIHSIGDYEEALETMRRENEHLCERIRTLEYSLTELKTQTDQGDAETIEQLRASQARVACYQETIRAATEENAELRATLEDLQSNQKELAYLKDRIAHDLAEVCVFHAKSIADSTVNRSQIPRQIDRSFHGKSIKVSTPNRSLSPSVGTKVSEPTRGSHAQEKTANAKSTRSISAQV